MIAASLVRKRESEDGEDEGASGRFKRVRRSKDAEIEQICGDNYQDFISSVSTLFDVKSYTTNLRERITTLDANVSQVGRGLVEKKRALLQSKKTAANLDGAIDTMQSCLRVLDVLNRIGDMVKDGKYWSALRVSPCLLFTQLIYIKYYIPVPRRHSEHASNLSVTNTILPASSVIVTLHARSDQRRSDGIDETMASRNQKCQYTSW